MSIALAVAYLKDAVKLNEVAKEKLLTIDLEANTVKFEGADTVKLPVINYSYIDTGDDDKEKALTTLSAYSRTAGFVPANLSLNWELFQLEQDMGNSLKLDAMDNEEGLAQELVPYIEQYIRTIEVPEIDAYRLDKLCKNAGTYKRNEVLNTGDKVYTALLNAFTTLKENEISGEQLVLYVPTTINSLFQQSTKLSRYIRVDEFRTGGVSTKIRYFNDAKIVVIPSGRWPEFFGTYEEEVDINFILVAPKSQLAVIKHRPAHFYPEGTVPGFDGSQVDMRIYHDLFVLPQREKGVYVNVKDKIWQVKFESNGGTAVPVQWVAHEGNAEAPDPAPTKTGHTFDGWYKEVGLSTKITDFSGFSIEKDEVVYAKWTEV